MEDTNEPSGDAGDEFLEHAGFVDAMEAFTRSHDTAVEDSAGVHVGFAAGIVWILSRIGRAGSNSGVAAVLERVQAEVLAEALKKTGFKS